MSLELSLKEFSLDLQNQTMVNTIVLPQGDSYSRKLIVSLYDNGQKYTIPKDVSVDMVGSRADGAVVNRHVDSYDGNVITLILRDEELDVKGIENYNINIRVKREDDKKVILSSFPFRIKVAENVYDSDAVLANPRIDVLEDTIEKAEQTLDKMLETDATINANEDVRKTNENDRIISEDTRKNQEQARVDAENDRVQEETKRVNAENTRKSNETARQSNETSRQSEEAKRVTAENNRVSAENDRENSESTRESNESTRKTNESNRESNEATRKTNETNRQTEESKRVTAETARVTAENTRNTNETTRKTNEANRENAENLRVTAENKRVEEFNTMKSDVETATANAEKVNIESIEGTESYKVKITDKTGASKISPNLLNKLSIGTVDTGDYNEEASATVTGNFGEQKLNLRLPTGKPFKIKKTYSSINLMNSNIEADLDLYEFCMINTGSVEDEDTGKLYMRDTNGASYITDLSGAQGIQGVKGETGATPNLTIGTVTTGAEGTKASATITGTKENPVINLTIPVGATGRMENVSAANIPYESATDTKMIKTVVDEIDKFAVRGFRTYNSGSSDMEGDMTKNPSLVGSYETKGGQDYWRNVISVRHRNGQDDGTQYGMLIKADLKSLDDLTWKQQIGGTWQDEKTILDSSNFTTYAASKSHTHAMSDISNWSTYVYDATVSRTANTVLAAPNGSAGKASFRKLVATDIPSLAYLPLSGGTMTGRLLVGTTKMTFAEGRISNISTGTTGVFSDGIAISNPSTSNDVGFIRVTGTGENDTVLEIATGDDGGAGEQIVLRQYNTSGAVAREAKLLDKSGNTSFPGRVTIGGSATLKYDSTNKCVTFTFS